MANTFEFGSYSGSKRSCSDCHTSNIRFQQRNKPKEPPKAPEQAPFFLPTLPGVETRFVQEQEDAEKAKTQKQKPTRRLEQAAAHVNSVFLHKLVEDKEDGDCK
jgi:U3 small nucleolar RNA-associated protein 21